MDFELPFKETSLGRLSDPLVPVMVLTRTGIHEHQFLIDTGSDFSLAPRTLAEHMGLDWEGLPRGSVRGVEQGVVPARFGRLPIRLGGVRLDVRCFFVDSPTALSVIGRADFVDRFILTIDQPHARITLQVVDA